MRSLSRLEKIWLFQPYGRKLTQGKNPRGTYVLRGVCEKIYSERPTGDNAYRWGRQKFPAVPARDALLCCEYVYHEISDEAHQRTGVQLQAVRQDLQQGRQLSSPRQDSPKDYTTRIEPSGVPPVRTTIFNSVLSPPPGQESMQPTPRRGMPAKLWRHRRRKHSVE